MWTDWNKDNRINTPEYSLYTSKKGLIENIIYAYKIGVAANVSKPQLEMFVIENFIYLYIVFNFYAGELSGLNIHTENNINLFLEWVIPMYDIFKNIDIKEIDIEDSIFRCSIEYYQRFKYRGTKYTYNEFIELLKQYKNNNETVITE